MDTRAPFRELGETQWVGIDDIDVETRNAERRQRLARGEAGAFRHQDTDRPSREWGHPRPYSIERRREVPDLASRNRDDLRAPSLEHVLQHDVLHIRRMDTLSQQFRFTAQNHRSLLRILREPTV